MGKKRLVLLAIACILVLVSSLAVYTQFTRNQENSWLAINDFVVYQQDFVWASGSSTTYMFWNITAISGSTACIELSSHGVQVANGTVTIPSAVVNLKINTNTREVTETSDQTGEMPVGSLFPLWITESVKVGDFVQTSYGDSTISPSQTIRIMGQDRSCWLVAYAFGAGNNMNRFYDTATGICLLIRTNIFSNNVSVSVNETAIQTNIKPL